MVCLFCRDWEESNMNCGVSLIKEETKDGNVIQKVCKIRKAKYCPSCGKRLPGTK